MSRGPVVSDLIDSYADSFAVVEYYGNDTRYQTPWGVARSDVFYSLAGATPTYILDGESEWPGPDYEYGLQQRLGEPTDVTIDLWAEEVGSPSTWDVTTEVCVEAGGAGREMRIYTIQVLDNYPRPPSYSRNTFRQAAPTSDVTIAPDTCAQVTNTFVLGADSMDALADVKIIAWAQAPSDQGPAPVYQAAQMGWPFDGPPEPEGPAEPELPRDFSLPVPLFDTAQSPWVEDATAAEVLPDGDLQIQATYRVLCGDTTGLYPSDDPPTTDWPFADITYDEYSLPIFGAGSGQQEVLLCSYDQERAFPNAKWGIETEGGPITVPSCDGTVRPAGPVGLDSDGHLILFDPATGTSYDLWQASTVVDGECQSQGGGILGTTIPEAGYADFFDVMTAGVNPDGVASARATGTPLLAGLIVPEEVESGAIEHALAVAIPGPRNLSPDPSEPLASDWFYPASTTETDMYSTNPDALAAGQRLRLKGSIVDEEGEVIDEDQLAPITRMFLAALRTYGAYVVDNASGFTFYAEDIHTAPLALDNAAVNQLIGQPPDSPLASDMTGWEIVIDTLNQDLEGIPFAHGACDGAASVVTTANFEVVEPAAMNDVTCTEPAIITEPESTTIATGDSATLEVEATGTAPLSYQWHLGDSGDTSNPIDGATEASYTTVPLSANASFWVRVSNDCGSVDSATVRIEVRRAPRRPRGRLGRP